MFFIGTNNCSRVCGPNSVVLRWLVLATGQAVAVTAANSTGAVLVASATLVVRLRPVDGCDSGKWHL